MSVAQQSKVREMIRRFEEKKPEIVFEWKDPLTDAEGWIVINSLRNGSAGGGTRMRKGLDKREVESLAKTMEIKFSVSGPPIGGAKSGINFDPADPRKKEVLDRWFKAVMPLLKGYYGTGGDLNVDEIHEVIPISERYGLRHPQEGTVVGHLNGTPEQTARVIHQLQVGVKKRLDDSEYTPDTSRNITVADMITGYGVAQSLLHYYRIYGGSLQGKRAIVQGWGNVGAAAGYYLSQWGVKIVGIIDRHGGVMSKDGFSHEEVTRFFLDRNGNQLQTDKLIPFDTIKNDVWHIGAEIFVPAAASRLVHREHIDWMMEKGLEVIACGANVPFADPEIFFGPIMEFADANLSVIPDFISNCGMARVFRYLMNDNAEITDKAIFNDTGLCISNAMQDVFAVNPSKTGISETGMEVALGKLL